MALNRLQRQPVGMSKILFRPTYIRAWRQYRNLTQERLADRIEITQATLSRIETGKQPYTQRILEGLADALQCSPADLLMRPPGTESDLERLLRGMKPETRKRAVAVLKALQDAEEVAA